MESDYSLPPSPVNDVETDYSLSWSPTNDYSLADYVTSKSHPRIVTQNLMSHVKLTSSLSCSVYGVFYMLVSVTGCSTGYLQGFQLVVISVGEFDVWNNWQLLYQLRLQYLVANDLEMLWFVLISSHFSLFDTDLIWLTELYFYYIDFPHTAYYSFIWWSWTGVGLIYLPSS